jgi:hypothetical protein
MSICRANRTIRQRKPGIRAEDLPPSILPRPDIQFRSAIRFDTTALRPVGDIKISSPFASRSTRSSSLAAQNRISSSFVIGRSNRNRNG